MSLFALSKEDSQVIKGLAILLMIFHHFFGAYSIPRILIPEHDPFCAHIAGWGKACVCLFAFVTGYGLMSKLVRREELSIMRMTSPLFSFFGIYVFSFLLTTLMAWSFPSLVQLNIPSSPPHFVLSSLMILPCYTDWWYATVFLLLAGVCYPCLCLIRLWCPVKALLVASCILAWLMHVFPHYAAACMIMVHVPQDFVVEVTKHFMLCSSFGMMFFIGGSYFFLTRREGGWRFKSAWLLVSAFTVSMMLLGMVACEYLWVALGFLLITFLCRGLPRMRRCLIVLGRYSVWMWLNHRLIFGYWFAKDFYAMPEWIALPLIVGLSFIVAVGTDTIYSRLVEGLNGVRKLRKEDCALEKIPS